MFKQKVTIIAEAGVNHNGSIELAKKLIDEAVDAGVDIVKFQTFKAENLVNKNAQKATYQIENTGNIESQFDMLKKLELNEENHIELQQYCATKGIEFWSTAFDNESLNLLQKLGISKWKIPSGEVTNLPFLEKIGSLQQEVILSTGMCNINEVQDALQILIKAGTKKNDITILHCNTEYPTPMKDVNMLAMLHLKNATGIENIGYSDHTDGIEVAIAAVALGAKVIEKHFTLNKKMEGPDHIASLEPLELKAMVKAIRNVETIIAGSGIKETTPSEQKNIAIARKSIVAKNDIVAGEIFTEKNITVKRPGTGISPMQWHSIIGKVAKKDFATEEQIVQ